MKTEHKHFFKHQGGGCYQDGRKFACDDDFQCSCGLKFRTLSDEIGHRYLPESWGVEPMSEAKQMEQSAQIQSKIDNTLNFKDKLKE